MVTIEGVNQSLSCLLSHATEPLRQHVDPQREKATDFVRSERTTNTTRVGTNQVLLQLSGTERKRSQDVRTCDMHAHGRPTI